MTHTHKITKQEDYISRKWRPMMAMSYMFINIYDFIIGPILYNVLEFLHPDQQITVYQAITLQNGGLFHLSMGAIIGVTAFGRTQEKLNGVHYTTETTEQIIPSPIVPSPTIPSPIVPSPTIPSPIVTPSTVPIVNYTQPIAPQPQINDNITNIATNKYGKIVPDTEMPVL